MKRATLLLLGLSVFAVRADDKGTPVNLDGLKSTTPATWESQKPSNFLRLMQFRIPKAKGDEADGDLAIFKGISGSKKENLERWQKQFLAPEGKKIGEVTKVTEKKVAGCELMYVEIEGIYLDGPPMAPAAAKKKKPGYRMLAVQLDGPDNVYHIKLVAPEKTVAAHKKGFDEWLEGFKK